MKSLDSFIKKNEPKKRVSKLNQFADEIMELHNKNYQVQQIQQFLNEQNIKIGTRRIYKFIKQNLSEKNFSLQTPSAVSTSEKNQTESIAQSDKQDTKAISAYKAKMQKLANQNKNKD